MITVAAHNVAGKTSRIIMGSKANFSSRTIFLICSQRGAMKEYVAKPANPAKGKARRIGAVETSWGEFRENKADKGYLSPIISIGHTVIKSKEWSNILNGEKSMSKPWPPLETEPLTMLIIRGKIPKRNPTVPTMVIILKSGVIVR